MTEITDRLSAIATRASARDPIDRVTFDRELDTFAVNGALPESVSIAAAILDHEESLHCLRPQALDTAVLAAIDDVRDADAAWAASPSNGTLATRESARNALRSLAWGQPFGRLAFIAFRRAGVA